MRIREVESLAEAEGCVGVVRINASVDDVLGQLDFSSAEIVPEDELSLEGLMSSIDEKIKLGGRIAVQKPREMESEEDLLKLQTQVDRLTDAFGKKRTFDYVSYQMDCAALVKEIDAIAAKIPIPPGMKYGNQTLEVKTHKDGKIEKVIYSAYGRLPCELETAKAIVMRNLLCAFFGTPTESQLVDIKQYQPIRVI